MGLPVSTVTFARDVNTLNRQNLGDGGLTYSNATSSEIDFAFLDFRNQNLTSNQSRHLKDWKFLLNRSTPAIELHFEKRFHQLFMQLVLCYKTDYVFREGKTIHQGFSAKNIGDTKFNAAHHATVPCLFACSKASKEEIVFLYRSSFYDESNATIDVIKQVNDADRAIDEKTMTSRLREKTVMLLNKTSKGLFTPPGAVKQFIKDLQCEIETAITKESKEVAEVLKIYLRKAEELKCFIDKPENIDLLLNLQIDDDPNLKKLRPTLYQMRYEMIFADQTAQSRIKSLLDKTLKEVKQNSRTSHFDDFFYYHVLKEADADEFRLRFARLLNVSPLSLEQKIREVKVNQNAHSAINKYANDLCKLSDDIHQKNLSTKVFEARMDVLLDLILKSAKVNREHVELLCYRRLYDRAETVGEKNKLAHLISSKTSLDQKIRKATKQTGAERAIIAQKDKIEEAVMACIKEMRVLVTKTNKYKGKLISELRKANKMTMEDLIKKINMNFSNKIDLNFLDAIEKGCTGISPKLTERFVEVFGVNSSLLSPSHFAG